MADARFFGLAAALIVTIAAAIARAAPPPPTAVAVPWDPAIRRGVLPNGLRYAVMSNATPTGALSIRLGLNVGSFDETDDERGAAHFIEHLAFGSDRPGAGPGAAFAAAGVAFGQDRNAETSAYATVYRIDIPRLDDGVSAGAFAWLRSVADGADFSPDAVDRERGVILAERAARLTGDTATARRAEAFMLPGQRYTARDPIGAPESLAAMTPQRLKAFYQAWNRPGNAVVAVVGDAPLDMLEAKVKATFSGWPPGPAPARPAYRPLDATPGLDALGQTQPNAESRLDVCRVRPATATPDAGARLRDRILSRLWQTVLQARLTTDVNDPSAALIAAQARDDWGSREVDGACLGATVSEDRWRPALGRLKSEIDRMAATAPTEPEMETAIRTVRSIYRGEVNVATTRQTRDLATALVQGLLRDEPVQAPARAFATFDDIVADLTPTDLEAAFLEDWSGAGPRIVARTPTPVVREALLAAWSDDAAHRGATAPDSAWAYQDFGKTGKAVRRETFTAPDFTRVTFANGVVLNWMHTDFAARQAKVAVTFGAGRREIADSDFAAAQIAALLFKQTGLGRHDYGALQRLFAASQGGADLKVGSNGFTLMGDTDQRGLQTELQLLAAYVSDPGFRDIDPLLATFLNALYRRYATFPVLVANQAITLAVAPGSPTAIPPQETLARMRTADIRRLFAPALAQAPLRVSIVGDVDEASATDWTARTFGALPARTATPRPTSAATFLRYPEAPPPRIEAVHEGPPEQALVEMVWPLYVAEPSRRREEYALGLVAALMHDRLLHRLRDDLGKTYSPVAETGLPDFADQGVLTALVETAPGDVEEARRDMAAVAADLAKGDFTAADLEAARAPLLSVWVEQEHANALWLAALTATAVWEAVPRELADRRRIVASLTLEEVRAAAARWLARPPIVAVVRPRPPTPHSGAAS